MRRAGWAVAVMAAAVLGGCGSDDDGPVKPPPPAGYPERTSPQNVLEAMQMAYTARDSNETKQVYDSGYVGTSTDLNDPPESQVSTFSFYDEARHVAVLAKSTTITSIVLDLGQKRDWLGSENHACGNLALPQRSDCLRAIKSHGRNFDAQRREEACSC